MKNLTGMKIYDSDYNRRDKGAIKNFHKTATEEITCPICGSGKTKFFVGKNNHNLYECINCDLVFVYPIPKNLNKIYNDEYFFKKEEKKIRNGAGYVNYEKDKESMRETFITYLKKLEELTANRKIFDIGTATAYFLDLARSRGWETAGVEISSYAAEIARNKGHKIFEGPLLDLKIEEQFGVVTMWDVLEHIDEPQKYLFAINNILQKGGILTINTIDRESWWARFWGSKWYSIIPPEHLFYFSLKNLKILFEKNGFKIIKVQKIGKKFPLAYIFQMLYNWQKFRIWNKLASRFDTNFWRKFVIPLNLRDNIFIIAQKIEEI